eukprot:tig00000388_g24813.t1
MSVRRTKRGGGATVKEFEEPATVQKFAGISNALQKKQNLQSIAKDGSLSPKTLALFTANLIQFMEDNLGRDSPKPRPVTRLPAKLLRDYAPDGSLAWIIETFMDWKLREQWRSFDWKNPQKRDRYLDIIKFVDKQLPKATRWVRPVVYFSPDIPSRDVEDMKRILKEHGASYVTNVAGATHVVVRDKPNDAPEADYCRAVEREPSRSVVFVHWWYYPDSYDEWIPAEEVQGDDEAEENKEKWHVYARWVRDLEKFNEWMNEGDYEPDEDGEQDRADRPKKKRKKGDEPRPRKEGEEADSAAGDDGDAASADAERARKKRKERESSGTGASSSGAQGLKIKIKSRESEAPGEEEGGAKKIRLAIKKPSGAERGEEEEEDEDEAGRPSSSKRPSKKGRDAEDEEEDEEEGAGSSVVKAEPREFGPNDEDVDDAERPRKGALVVKKLPNKPVRKKEGERTVNVSEAGVPRPPRPELPVSLQARTSEADLAALDRSTPIPADGKEASASPPPDPRAPPPIVVPSYSAWFSLTRIHDIEQRYLEEFFNGENPSKTPSIYKEYRDFMVQQYRRAPHEYLSATWCRKHLVGDVNAILRVHSFLEQWGLLNYMVAPEKRPAGCLAPLNMPAPEPVLKDTPDTFLVGAGGAASAGALLGPLGAAASGGVGLVGTRGPAPEGARDVFVLQQQVVAQQQMLAAQQRRIRELERATRPPALGALEPAQAFFASRGDRTAASTLQGQLAARHEAFRSVSLNLDVHGSIARVHEMQGKAHQMIEQLKADFAAETQRLLQQQAQETAKEKRHQSEQLAKFQAIKDKQLSELRQKQEAANQERTQKAEAELKQLQETREADLRARQAGVPPEQAAQIAQQVNAHYEPQIKALRQKLQTEKQQEEEKQQKEVEAKMAEYQQEIIKLSNLQSGELQKSAVKQGEERVKLRQMQEMRLAEAQQLAARYAQERFHTLTSVVPPKPAPSPAGASAAPAPPPGGGGKAGEAAGEEGEWTEEETLALLEALETHGERWEEVAAKVGSKTPEQCVLRFVRLPIEEPFLEEQHGRAAAMGRLRRGEFEERADYEAAPSALVPGGPLPFTDTGNPILAQLAFLASAVGPNIAAAAAQAALGAILREMGEAEAQAEAEVVRRKAEGEEGKAPAEGTASDPMVIDGEEKKGEGKEAEVKGEAGGEAKVGEARGAGRAMSAETLAATTLAAAAVKAKLVAEREEREVQRLVAFAVEAQLRKVELKLRYFEEMEEALHQERCQVEALRQQLFQERAQFARQKAALLAQQQAAAQAQAARAQQPAQAPAASAAAAAAPQQAAGSALGHAQQAALGQHPGYGSRLSLPVSAGTGAGYGMQAGYGGVAAGMARYQAQGSYQQQGPFDPSS